MNNLRPKHQRFVAEYLKDQNATQAAIRAGYTEKSANVNGPRLLVNARIKAAIDAELSKVVRESRAGLGRVLEVLTTHMEAKLGDYVNEKGEIDISRVRQAPAGVVVGLEGGKNGKLRLTSSQAAAEKLLRYHTGAYAAEHAPPPPPPQQIAIHIERLDVHELRMLLAMRKKVLHGGNGRAGNGNGEAA